MSFYFDKMQRNLIFYRLHIIVVGNCSLFIALPQSLCPHFDSHIIVINGQFFQSEFNGFFKHLACHIPHGSHVRIFAGPLQYFFNAVMDKKSAITVYMCLLVK